MANIDDFNAKLEAIKAIPDENVEQPNLPVDVALQENENLHKWGLADAAKLATAGISQEMLDEFPVRIGACREAESIWNKDFRSQKEAQKEWSAQSPLAYEQRDRILHTMRFAYRKDEALLKRVAAIADGNGHADMIQDLNDLSVLGKENPEPLTAVSFDLAELDTSGNTSDSMASLLAEANGDKAEQNESKVIRDKAYLYMKELADEIRAVGKFVFWKDKTRYKGYTSSFWRHKNSRKTKPSEIHSKAGQE